MISPSARRATNALRRISVRYATWMSVSARKAATKGVNHEALKIGDTYYDKALMARTL